MKVLLSLLILLAVMGYNILASPLAAEYSGYSFEPEVLEAYGIEPEPPNSTNQTEVPKKLPALEVHTGAWSTDTSHDLLAFTYDNIMLSIYKDEDGLEHYGAGYVLRYDYSVFELGAELGCNTDTDFHSTKCHVRPTITYTEYILQPVIGYAHGSIIFSLRWRLHNGTY